MTSLFFPPGIYLPDSINGQPDHNLDNMRKRQPGNNHLTCRSESVRHCRTIFYVFIFCHVSIAQP